MFSNGTAVLEIPPTYPTQQRRGKPASGREHNMLPAAKGRASSGLPLHCGGVSREAKPRKTHPDGFVHTLTSES